MYPKSSLMRKMAENNKLETYSRIRIGLIILLRLVVLIVVAMVWAAYFLTADEVNMVNIYSPLSLTILLIILPVFIQLEQNEDSVFKWKSFGEDDPAKLAAKIMAKIPPRSEVIKYIHRANGENEVEERVLLWVEIVSKIDETWLVIHYADEIQAYELTNEFQVRVGFLDSTVTLQRGGLREIFLPIE